MKDNNRYKKVGAGRKKRAFEKEKHLGLGRRFIRHREENNRKLSEFENKTGTQEKKTVDS